VTLRWLIGIAGDLAAGFAVDIARAALARRGLAVVPARVVVELRAEVRVLREELAEALNERDAANDRAAEAELTQGVAAYRGAVAGGRA